MKASPAAVFVPLMLLSLANAQTPSPFFPDANTVALWHFNELSGSLVRDSSGINNNGNAIGTTIGVGRFGNCRVFNGIADYIYVSNPTNGSLGFGSNQSFTIDVWFKTTSQTGWLLRKGLAPTPGYGLAISNGHVQGELGNREDSHYPDTLVRIRSQQTYNNGQWHLATLEHDRVARKIRLYVDGSLATPPLDDPIVFSLSSDRPLTLGKWENNVQPDYFAGSIDEVRISNIARSAPIVESDTLGLWHLDELSGQTIFDSSPYHTNGTAYGTTIISGQSGNARDFNGLNDYVYFPNPQQGQFNFSPSQSFTIDAWFRTTGTEGHILRRGLVFSPGFLLGIHFGRLSAMIGNHQGNTWSDTLLLILSNQNVNDGNWHRATFVRDRSQQKLFLYVDGLLSTAPINDNFTIPLVNDRPLTLGRWENFADPWLFRGAIDEVAIFRGARHPVNIGLPIIQVSPLQLNFGNVLVGSQTVRDAFVTNIGFHDTLQISVQTTNPVFNASIPITYPIPPGVTRNVPVMYLPTAARTDTGSLMIWSNDPNRPLVRIPLNGQGFAPTAAPFILSIRDIPEDQGKQVRVIWYKSLHDTVGDSLRVGQYNLWRRVGANNNLWDFIATIPAARFQQYSYVAPTLFDSSRTLGIRWSVFKVSAHTASGAEIYFSAADSGYSVDNIPPNAPANLSGTFVAGRVNLGWDAPPDPDIEMYAVYRSTIPDFVPSIANQIGTTPTNSFVDQNIGGGSAFYYRVAALDTTGNLGAVSSQVRVVVTDVGGGNTLPTEFALYQNYPNPFNPSSVVRYDVPFTSHVTIKVFDLLGKEVATLVDEQKSAGTHEVRMTAGALASGVYLYRMQSGEYVSVKKMILMK
jgi:hypothetical protein